MSPERWIAELDFEHRAHLSEWMDEPCSYEDFRACLRDLAQVNVLTFAHRPTLKWLEQFADAKRTLHIVDVGCGGGDMLRAIERWAADEGVAVRLTGIDLNPYAAQAAHEFTSSTSRIEWVTGDAFSWQTPVPIDIVISSLFTHHLPHAEIVHFLQWMESTAQLGWFINDLYRAHTPYRAFTALAWAMRWHRFVRHDGPVSIRRAFREDDWQGYLAQAEIAPNAVEITGYWPARLCVSRVRR